jgi:nitrite reductase/ring-hydroxylating ferredoxin subunit
VSARIRVGIVDELEGSRVLHATMTPDADGTPREALVMRDAGGVVRAYLNRCRHLPIPLDGGTRRFLDDDRRYLMCGTHGALYRLEDGYCFVGPCRGESLRAIAVEVDAAGAIWIDGR